MGKHDKDVTILMATVPEGEFDEERTKSLLKRLEAATAKLTQLVEHIKKQNDVIAAKDEEIRKLKERNAALERKLIEEIIGG